ncbi:putative WRKY transcription factor 53 [Nicotiana tabacum]|uniref:WRKY transcription factor 53 n=1 Tax=Nicotiana tabacum TaxID=4097 RepID=A0A1S4C5W4_TOBAC|nr:PREDICTED: probable WRKY transcription factor 53 [Nicotiana tabacum]
MDCGFNWEYNSLINELTQGMGHAKQLRAYFSSAASSCSSNKIQELHLHMQMILSSFENSLSILKWTGSITQTPQLVVAPPISNVALESSFSVDESPKTVDLNGNFKENDQDLRYVSKKRKQLPTWTEQVRVSAENGFEGPTDDGYSWRKYGQKDILGAKYPRSYYRCTYRLMQNCWATKQVQRSDDDPTLFEITYKGSHTCNQAFNSAHTTSSEKHEFKKQANNPKIVQSNQMLANLQANLRVNTNDLDKKETTCSFPFSPTFSGFVDENLHFQVSQVDDNLVGGYSPSFISPTTPESSYFSLRSCQMNGSQRIHSLHNSESDLPDLFSANTSSTSSPIVGLEFPLEHVELDPNFPFDNSEFFR